MAPSGGAQRAERGEKAGLNLQMCSGTMIDHHVAFVKGVDIKKLINMQFPKIHMHVFAV